MPNFSSPAAPATPAASTRRRAASPEGSHDAALPSGVAAVPTSARVPSGAAFDVARAALQTAALIGGFALVERLCDAWGVGTLAAPLGFVLLLGLLASGRLPVGLVLHGGKWLIAGSTLFLIPAIVAVAPAWPILSAHWVALSAIIVGGTSITLLATAWSVEATCRWMARSR